MKQISYVVFDTTKYFIFEQKIVMQYLLWLVHQLSICLTESIFYNQVHGPQTQTYLK